MARDRPQDIRGASDGDSVERLRSPLHRLAPVAMTALGIFGAVLMISAGLRAPTHTVLPFDACPLNGARPTNGTQVLPRAPAETGRLRTATGGALGAINNGSVGISPPSTSTAGGVAGTQATTGPGLGSTPQRGGSSSAAPRPPLLSRAGVDTDHDGGDNPPEHQPRTHPLAGDPDGDGIPDGWEVANGLSPTVAADAT